MTEVNLMRPKNINEHKARQLRNHINLLTTLISHNQNGGSGAESFWIEDLQWHQVLREDL